MRFSINYLRKFVANLPANAKQLIEICDDVGLEIKKQDITEDDTILTIELLANRGDHHSYYGVARELYGRLLESKMIFPEIAVIKDKTTERKVYFESPRDVLSYAVMSAECLEKNEFFPLSEEYSKLLDISQIRSQNIILDLLNVVSLEFGQHLLAYDAEKIKGDIQIRKTNSNEEVLLVDAEQTITLPQGVLVVCDAEKILSIAGLMVCAGVNLTTKTRKILLETAVFDPVTIRQNSQKLKVKTHISGAIEKGGDSSLLLRVLQRIAFLLQKHKVCNQVALDFFADETKKLPLSSIMIHPDKSAKFLGMDSLSSSVIAARLERYGFGIRASDAGEIAISIPFHRYWDIKRKEDIYEELARAIGYNNLPEELYIGALDNQEWNQKEQFKESSEAILIANGFYEYFTNAFYNHGTLKKLNIDNDHPLFPHIKVQNAIEKDHALLKNNCIAHAMQLVQENFKWGSKNLKVFEWARIFLPNKMEQREGGSNEKEVLWGVIVGNRFLSDWQIKSSPVNLFYIKGIVEYILGVRIQNRITWQPMVAEDPLFLFLHPYRALKVSYQGKIVALCGEIHPRICASFDIKQKVYYFEIYIAEILGILDELKQENFSFPPLMPPIERYLTFSIPRFFYAEDITDYIRSLAKMRDCAIFLTDSYDFIDNENKPARSITLRLLFENTFGLRNETINDICDELILKVEQKFTDVFLKK